MADEINLQFTLREPAMRGMEEWKASPPDALRGMELVDETFETLIYEGRYEDWPAKLVNVASLGLNKRLFGGMDSIWKLSVRFDAVSDYECKVTVLGKAHEQARAALGRLAAERGTIVHAGGVPTAP